MADKKDEADDLIALPCTNCGKITFYRADSYEAKGVFMPFCTKADCEDEYSAKL